MKRSAAGATGIVRRVTARGIAVWLTIWFTTLNALVLFRVPVTDRFFIVANAAIYSYFLLPVRWAAVTLLFVRTVRDKPLPLLPRTSAFQVAVALVVQSVLGILSLAGWWSLWRDTSRMRERVVGFVFHAALPSMMVFLLVRGRISHGTSRSTSGV